MSRFTITLPSSSSVDYHPNNTASQYTTKLNEVIELDGSWEVGLLETSFPSKLDNVSADNFYYIVYTASNTYARIVLPAGRYTTADDIIDALHTAQRKVLRIPPEHEVFVLFRSLRRNQRIAMKILPGRVHIVSVRFSPDLARMLGFDSNTNYGGHVEYRGERPLDLMEKKQNLLYIYCDLLEHVLVGDTKAPLLRIVSRSPEMSSDVDHITFNPVQYVPLQKKCFDSVTINMMTDTGVPMSFVPGKSIVVLEFRRSVHPYLFV